MWAYGEYDFAIVQVWEFEKMGQYTLFNFDLLLILRIQQLNITKQI